MIKTKPAAGRWEHEVHSWLAKLTTYGSEAAIPPTRNWTKGIKLFGNFMIPYGSLLNVSVHLPEQRRQPWRQLFGVNFLEEVASKRVINILFLSVRQAEINNQLKIAPINYLSKEKLHFMRWLP